MIRILPSRKAERQIAIGEMVAVVQEWKGARRAVAVTVDGPEHAKAREGLDGWAMPLDAFRDDADTFADVAHDDGGMIALYDLLEGHAALWATGMPVGTPRAEARRFMLACVDALADRMRAVVIDTISEDIALPWGECSECSDGGEE
jgi:hypothetical protein